jgi:hypothetical protein
MSTLIVVEQQPVDLLPKRYDVEITTKLKPVAGPRVRRAAGRENSTPAPVRQSHRRGTPGTYYVCDRFPGLVGARVRGGAW